MLKGEKQNPRASAAVNSADKVSRNASVQSFVSKQATYVEEVTRMLTVKSGHQLARKQVGCSQRLLSCDLSEFGVIVLERGLNNCFRL